MTISMAAGPMMFDRRTPIERLETIRRRMALAGGSLAVVATLAGWRPSGTAALVIGIAAVAVGMPHGALDVVVGPRAMPQRGFFAIYGALALATVMVWLVLPMASLLVFLAASWFHFGSGDAVQHRVLGDARTLLGLATAGCAIGLPLVAHTETVTPLLSDLLLARGTLQTDDVRMFGLAIVVPTVAAGLVAVAAAMRARQVDAVAELIAIAVTGAVVHPLVSFAIYFVLWHAPRHVMSLDIDAAAWKPTIVATLGTLWLGGFLWLAVEPSAVQATRVVFIGLAALTVPHLLVTEAERVRRAPRPPTT